MKGGKRIVFIFTMVLAASTIMKWWQNSITAINGIDLTMGRITLLFVAINITIIFVHNGTPGSSFSIIGAITNGLLIFYLLNKFSGMAIATINAQRYDIEPGIGFYLAMLSSLAIIIGYLIKMPKEIV